MDVIHHDRLTGEWRMYVLHNYMKLDDYCFAMLDGIVITVSRPSLADRRYKIICALLQKILGILALL